MDDYSSSNNDFSQDREEGSRYYNSPFYVSGETRNGRNKKNILSYILVALISSAVGGIAAGFIFLAARPMVEPVMDKTVGNLFQALATQISTNSNSDAQTSLRKIEIEETVSPVVAIAEKVGPSIAGIKVTYKVVSPFNFFGDFESQGEGEGSGIIVTKDGYILTNYHVIEKAYSSTNKKMAGEIQVYLPNNKKPISAKVVGTDARTDLAVIKIEQDNLPEAELGNSSELRVGELAVAIGNPLGLEFAGSVTAGVVSAVNRSMEVDGKKLTLIQTDAAINPGNSGGALVNSKGQVIGVNTVKLASTGIEGLGFAIPIDEVKPIMEQLIKYTYVKGRPQIGIGGVNVDEHTSRVYDIPVGVYVRQVFPFSGAEKAGIQVGDVIVEFGGKPVKTIEELNDIKEGFKAGDTVKVAIIREGKRMTINLKLTEER